MTQVGRIIQREFNEAVQHLEIENQQMREQNEQLQEENKKNRLTTIRNLSSRNFSVDDIMSIIPGVSRKQVIAAIAGNDEALS